MNNEESTKNEGTESPQTNEKEATQPAAPLSPLDEFVSYCKENPDERFWQAVRNFAGADYVLLGNMTNRKGTKDHAKLDGIKIYVHDTYHFTGRDS